MRIVKSIAYIYRVKQKESGLKFKTDSPPNQHKQTNSFESDKINSFLLTLFDIDLLTSEVSREQNL